MKMVFKNDLTPRLIYPFLCRLEADLQDNEWFVSGKVRTLLFPSLPHISPTLSPVLLVSLITNNTCVGMFLPSEVFRSLIKPSESIRDRPLQKRKLPMTSSLHSYHIAGPQHGQSVDCLVLDIVTLYLQVTWADLAIGLIMGGLKKFDEELLKKFPAVEALVSRVLDLPEIKQWNEQQPELPF